jgi:hypothetical protein
MPSDAEKAFVQATDRLIALYRNVERNTLDLPFLSFMPFLIFFWAVLRFYFFFFVGLFLIIPTNLVILIRNLFPGHWRYRPFFLRHVYYILLWIWRGEAPTAPFIFIRPLLNVLMKGHFERRLRRLRQEIVLYGDLSDAIRSALVGRLDAALERWKAPRLVAAFFTVVLPGIISLLGLYKQTLEFLESIGIRLPRGVVGNFVSEYMSTGGPLILSILGYLLAIPVTAFLAKRGLFIGRNPDRICFPGGQGGSGTYSEERDIFASVGLHAREAPIDLWILGVGFALFQLLLLLTWDRWIAWTRLHSPAGESQLLIQEILQVVLFVGLFFVAALRRGRTGRL